MENKHLTDQNPDKWMVSWSRQLVEHAQIALAQPEQAMTYIQELLMATTRGESCIALDLAGRQSLAQLLLDANTITSNLQQQIAPLVCDDQSVYLYRYWALEYSLAQHVYRIQQHAMPVIDLSPFQNLLQDQQQRQALQMVATQALSVITGGPGTGKTYTLARIIAVLNHAQSDLRIAMAAPTGKAAQRMKEALQNSFADPKLEHLLNAKLKQQDTLTLHRLLGLGHHRQPRYHAQHPLPYDVVVVDEASMIDLQMATYLCAAIAAGSRLILLGDAQQLASVDVGAVLADLQQVDALQANRVHLLTSRRFNADSPIGQMARFIQKYATSELSPSQRLKLFEQEVITATEFALPDLSGDQAQADQMCLSYLPTQLTTAELQQKLQILSSGYAAYFKALDEYALQYRVADDPHALERAIQAVLHAFDGYRILTAIHFGHLGLNALNQAVEAALLQQLTHVVQQGEWYLGRPVMMSYNDDQLGLSNGDIGICFYHRSQTNQFEVYFPALDYWVAATRLPKSIHTAFAMTIHKSQGSEFQHVAVVLDAAAQRLLSQELLYTAITRAKTTLSLLVHPESLVQSLAVKTSRKSGLVEKLESAFRSI